MRLWLLLLVATLAGASARAQVVGSNVKPGSDGTYTISTGTKLVIEAVSVKDKAGKSITGLTAKDFTVTEDGIAQKVTFLEYQELPTGPPPTPVKAPPENVQVYNRLAISQIAPETAGKVRYKDRRLISMYFDLTAMPPGDQVRALEAAQKFIRTQMTSVDLVSIMRYGGSSVDVLQDFTDDHDKLLSILATLIVGENQQSEDTTNDAASADTGAAFGQDSGEFNLFNTDRQLSALQTAAKMLGRLSEKKVLIYFASGLSLHGLDNQAQLHATVDDAIRSGVSFWPIDARGLVAQAPLGDATQGSPGGTSMYNGTAASGGHDAPAAIAGHALRACGRHRRQGAARLQRPHPRHRAGAAEHLQLLHPGLLHGQHDARRTLSQDQDQLWPTRSSTRSWTIAWATMPARSSASSPRPTRTGSLKTR